MDVLFLKSIFRCHPGLNVSFEHKIVRKSLFLSTCFCWDSRLYLHGKHRKFKFGGTIGYGDWYLAFLYPHFEVIRLHAILHDAAAAVPAHSGEGRGYFYMIGRGSNSCLLGHVTGLLFCLHEKLFLPSVFNCVDF